MEISFIENVWLIHLKVLFQVDISLMANQALNDAYQSLVGARL